MTRQFVSINVAITADGKIAPADRRFVPFTTPRDHELMMELRARADAVMCGARTVEIGEVTLGSGGAKYRRLRKRRGLSEENLRVIVSGSGSVNPKAHIFTQRFSPIIILTSERADKRLRTLNELADAVHVSTGDQVQFAHALEWLRKTWSVKRLLCEGGGEVNAALFEAGLVDEVFVTIAPLLLGGMRAPTLSDGWGVAKLADAAQFALKEMRQVGDELYAVFRKT